MASDFRPYWSSNQHVVRTATPSSVHATGIMAMKWFILERPVRYCVVPTGRKKMGAAHRNEAHPHRHRKVEQKSFAVAKVRPEALG
jgi:hypothetical protein